MTTNVSQLNASAQGARAAGNYALARIMEDAAEALNISERGLENMVDEANAESIRAEKAEAEVRELRAALGRLQGEVETIINTEPHADGCRVVSRECNCWQARLSKALDGDK